MSLKKFYFYKLNCNSVELYNSMSLKGTNFKNNSEKKTKLLPLRTKKAKDFKNVIGR